MSFRQVQRALHFPLSTRSPPLLACLMPHTHLHLHPPSTIIYTHTMSPPPPPPQQQGGPYSNNDQYPPGMMPPPPPGMAPPPGMTLPPVSSLSLSRKFLTMLCKFLVICIRWIYSYPKCTLDITTDTQLSIIFCASSILYIIIGNAPTTGNGTAFIF